MTTKGTTKGPGPAAERVYHLARQECGFALVGITEACPSRYAPLVREWISAGRHGEMRYLADNLEVRLDPGQLLEGAASIIAVADAYPATGTEETQHPKTARGRIARYAWGDDYHKVMKGRLHRLADLLKAEHPAHAFRATVDTAPALEREHAARAGLGWQGKNTMMIHPRHGSYLLLGLIVTTLPLEPSLTKNPPTDHCGTCTRCIDACPTQCITSDPRPGSPAGRSIDATRCISYLTLEHRSAVDEALHPLMGAWVAGCDVCQEVCPFNRVAADEPMPFEEARPSGAPSHRELLPVHPRYRPRPTFAEGMGLLGVLGWTEEDRRAAFVGSALKRIKLDMLKRNALIAAGNWLAEHEDALLRARVEAIEGDEEEGHMVRGTAKSVLSRLRAMERGVAGA